MHGETLKYNNLFFVLEVATRLLDGQTRDLTTVIYAGIFKFLMHKYKYIYIHIHIEKVVLFYSRWISDSVFASSKIINLGIATGTLDKLIPVAAVLAGTR